MARSGWSELPSLVGEVGELSFADVDATVRHLLERTCELIGASDALLSFGVRSTAVADDDPLGGWRGTFALRYGPNAERDARILDEWYHHLPNLPQDHAIVTLARTAGASRAFLEPDLTPGSRLQQRRVRELLRECRIRDRIVGGRPIGGGLELLFGAYRRDGTPCFSDEERDLVRGILASIPDVARRLALACGVFSCGERLTPREGQVLQHLLSGLAEKEIAYELGLGARTLHHHVTALYRKLGVRSRAELMALFLGTLRRKSGAQVGAFSIDVSRSDQPAGNAPAVSTTASSSSRTPHTAA
ncbi:MAG TPA: LuxR C-terminal-related transcriptional regulator [Candidatus Binatia bacterium]